MEFESFFVLLGVNLVAYSIFMLLCYYAEDAPETRGKVLESLSYLFLLFSLPGCIPIGLVEKLYDKRAYTRHLSDMRKLRYIAERQCKPEDWAIKTYGLCCKNYENEFGEFNLYDWKRDEYEKLGL